MGVKWSPDHGYAAMPDGLCFYCRFPESAHQTAPAVDSDDGTEPSGAPWGGTGAPLQNASPWPLPEACTDWPTCDEGWRRAIDLAGHVARLTGVLELMLHRLDSGIGVDEPDAALAQDAIAKAREATA